MEGARAFTVCCVWRPNAESGSHEAYYSVRTISHNRAFEHFEASRKVEPQTSVCWKTSRCTGTVKPVQEFVAMFDVCERIRGVYAM
jgi:hypothetical protein